MNNSDKSNYLLLCLRRLAVLYLFMGLSTQLASANDYPRGTVDFGSVHLEESRQRNFALSVISLLPIAGCEAPARIESVGFLHREGPGQISLIGSNPGLYPGLVLDRNATIGFSVKFDPRDEGRTRNQLIIVASCDADVHGTHRFFIDVMGTGVLSPFNWRALAPTFDAGNKVTFGYQVTSPEPVGPRGGGVTVGLYWSSTSQLPLGDLTRLTWANIEVSFRNGMIDTYTLPPVDYLSERPPSARYLVTIVDPLNKVRETNENDNIALVPLVPRIINQIPEIMHNLDWRLPERFQRRWLQGQARVATGKTFGDNLSEKDPSKRLDVVSQELKMKWLLDPRTTANSRVINAYNQLLNREYYDTLETRKALRANLQEKFNHTTSHRIDFGNFSASGKDLHNQHIQHIDVRSYTSPLPVIDKVTAALGNFALYLIPKGVAEEKGSEIHVTVTEMGVYAGDVYEFNGDQQLGYWAFPDKVTLRHIMGSTPVWNQDYNFYRQLTGKGRDFIIISNVKRTTLNPPWTFTLRR